MLTYSGIIAFVGMLCVTLSPSIYWSSINPYGPFLTAVGGFALAGAGLSSIGPILVSQTGTDVSISLSFLSYPLPLPSLPTHPIDRQAAGTWHESGWQNRQLDSVFLSGFTRRTTYIRWAVQFADFAKMGTTC